MAKYRAVISYEFEYTIDTDDVHRYFGDEEWIHSDNPEAIAEAMADFDGDRLEVWDLLELSEGIEFMGSRVVPVDCESPE